MQQSKGNMYSARAPCQISCEFRERPAHSGLSVRFARLSDISHWLTCAAYSYCKSMIVQRWPLIAGRFRWDGNKITNRWYDYRDDIFLPVFCYCRSGIIRVGSVRPSLHPFIYPCVCAWCMHVYACMHASSQPATQSNNQPAIQSASQPMTHPPIHSTIQPTIAYRCLKTLLRKSGSVTVTL